MPNDKSQHPGRRSKADGPSFPTVEVDQLLVHGEVIQNEDGTGTHVHYPTYRELAARYGVAHSLTGTSAGRGHTDPWLRPWPVEADQLEDEQPAIAVNPAGVDLA